MIFASTDSKTGGPAIGDNKQWLLFWEGRDKHKKKSSLKPLVAVQLIDLGCVDFIWDFSERLLVSA
jgi:hypothetical protein